VSPCPLATNIAAITFIGRRLERPRQVLVGGLAYTAGRAVTYVALGALLAASVLNAPMASLLLQKHANRILGPILVLAGMFLLELLRLPVPGGGAVARLGERVGQRGGWGAAVLGAVFALSFCPLSAVLFFGSLVPLAVSSGSWVLLPSVYGVGTGLPVLVVAILVALGARSLGSALDRMAAFGRWARSGTGVVFIAVGIYYSLAYVYRVVD